jgi:NADH-quinone oxidoreductase subunit N
MEIVIPDVNWIALAPQIIVIVTGLAVLLLGVAAGSERKSYLAYLSLVGVVLAALVALYFWDVNEPAFPGMIAVDALAAYLNLAFLVAAGLSILLSVNYVERMGFAEGEYYSLMLISVSGMMFLANATNLMVVFLGLEILSIPLYVLVGFNRKEVRSGEASLKYFLLGAFASAFLLYGIALLYGGTGTTSLPGIAEYLALASSASAYVWIGIGLVVVGLGFKVALVPFHMWTPDVYQGAPTPITAFMSFGAKAAAFAALIRILVGALAGQAAGWSWILAVLAILTMVVGNVAAIAQTNLKRMLAYSSIAHAGYITVGLVAGSIQGVQAVLFYLAGYLFMNVGAFAVIVALSRDRRGEDGERLNDFAGLGKTQPWLAAAMTVFMFSLAGIPPLVGFVGKLYVFAAAVEGGWWWLAAVGVFNSVISAYFYLRVVLTMYMRPPAEEGRKLTVHPALAVALVVAVVLTVLIGLLPGALVWLTQAAVVGWGV